MCWNENSHASIRQQKKPSSVSEEPAPSMKRPPPTPSKSVGEVILKSEDRGKGHSPLKSVNVSSGIPIWPELDELRRLHETKLDKDVSWMKEPHLKLEVTKDLALLGAA